MKEIHKLICKYVSIGKELEKRKEAVIYDEDIHIIDLQIRTNEAFIKDLMSAAGALL